MRGVLSKHRKRKKGKSAPRLLKDDLLKHVRGQYASSARSVETLVGLRTEKRTPRSTLLVDAVFWRDACAGLDEAACALACLRGLTHLCQTWLGRVRSLHSYHFFKWRDLDCAGRISL